MRPIPQWIAFRESTVTDQITEGEPVRCREADVLPAVPSPHGRVPLDPAREELVRAVIAVRREDEEREVIGVDVLDVVECLTERAFGGPGDADFARQRAEDFRTVGRMPRLGPKHVAHFMRDEAVEET